MNVTMEQVGAVSVVRVSGPLDSSTADDFGARMLEIGKAGGARLVIDMEQVAYVSSAGLRVLLSLFKQLKANGGALILANVHSRVQDIFDIAGFSAILPVESTTAGAIASLS